MNEDFRGPCLKCEVEGHNNRIQQLGESAECPRCGFMNRADLMRWEDEYVARQMAGS